MTKHTEKVKEIATVIDDFYSTAPKYRTKKRLIEMLTNHFK